LDDIFDLSFDLLSDGLRITSRDFPANRIGFYFNDRNLATFLVNERRYNAVDDDQIVPYADSAPLSAKLLRNSTLKTLQGLSTRHAYD
jgi:hypothetical protein